MRCCSSAMADSSWLHSHMTFPYPFLDFARRRCQHCDLHNGEKNAKIFGRIKIILKGAITEIQHLRAKFEPEKSNFDATPYHRFGSLGYDKIACGCAREKIPSKLMCNSLTQAGWEGSGNSQHAYVPNGCFLNSFLFAHFYLFFLFLYPLP